MAEFTVEAVESENYEGRQWGYMLCRDGRPEFHATTGGTGACWNFRSVDDEEDTLHVCELDDFAALLTALLNSEAHEQHVERWSS